MDNESPSLVVTWMCAKKFLNLAAESSGWAASEQHKDMTFLIYLVKEHSDEAMELWETTNDDESPVKELSWSFNAVWVDRQDHEEAA
eukprot:s8274_g4.t1